MWSRIERCYRAERFMYSGRYNYALEAYADGVFR